MEGFQTSILVCFHELFTVLHPQWVYFAHLFIIAMYTNLILVEWTGAEGSMVPTILLASMSLVWVELAEIPWYSWISGSNTSENTCNRGHSQPEPEFLNSYGAGDLFQGTKSACLCRLAGRYSGTVNQSQNF
jgi:hypothetical protein